MREGRREFLSQFPGAASADGREALEDPGAEVTFRRSTLDWTECTQGNAALRLHRDLLALRREDPVIRGQGCDGFDGAVLGEKAFLLRWFHAGEGDRLLLVNLGSDIRGQSLPEPLLAAPSGRSWSPIWCSEHARYGGSGSVDPDAAQGWRLPGQCAILLVALPEPA